MEVGHFYQRALVSADGGFRQWNADVAYDGGDDAGAKPPEGAFERYAVAIRRRKSNRLML